MISSALEKSGRPYLIMAAVLAIGLAQHAPRASQAAEGSGAAEYGHGVPPVLLTEGHRKLCTVGVGDELPAIELQKLGGGEASTAALAGKQATVVLFWTPGHWMSRVALADVTKDVAAKMPEQVAVVGIAIGDAAKIKTSVERAKAGFTQLVDPQGESLSKVGVGSLPRVYVLDSSGRIAWFDIEYSEATRRELAATLAALAK